MRRLLRPVRLGSRLVTLAWVWRNRHDLARWTRFLMRLPADVKVRDRSEIVTEVRARAALSMDERTRRAGDLDIRSLGDADGVVVVRTHPAKATAGVASEVLDRVPGVLRVDVVDAQQAGGASTPTEPVVTASA
jgi:hypothetical protein